MGFGIDFVKDYNKRYFGSGAKDRFWSTGGDPTLGAFYDIGENAQLSDNMIDQPKYTNFVPTPAETGLRDRMNPTASNPQLARWVQAAARPYGGTSTAAGAAAGRMAQSRGVSAMTNNAMGYWQRLMNMAIDFRSNADKITTTSPDAAGLQGFLGGGGATGIGSLFGGK